MKIKRSCILPLALALSLGAFSPIINAKNSYPSKVFYTIAGLGALGSFAIWLPEMHAAIKQLITKTTYFTQPTGTPQTRVCSNAMRLALDAILIKLCYEKVFAD